MDASTHHRPSRRRRAAAALTLAGVVSVGAGITPATAAAPPPAQPPAAGTSGAASTATAATGTASTATVATGGLVAGDLVPFGQGQMGAGAHPTGTGGTGAGRPGAARPNAAERSGSGSASTFSAQAVTASPTLPAGWPRGVDISSWQHPDGAAVDWRAVRRSGVRFAFIKATEGDGYTNPYYQADRHAGWSAGLVIGAYHYARPAWPASTAATQARYFIAAAGNSRGTNQLASVLDLEATGGLSASQLRTWALTFLQTVENLTGRAPTLYTYRSFWTDTMGNTRAFAKYPLWFAIYNGERGPGALPGGWAGWRFWQNTSGGLVPGIRGAVDLDVYCCTFTSFWPLTDGRASDLWNRYAHSASLRALLGPPVRDERPAGGGGRWQPFRNGLLFWSVDTGTREVHGGIEAKYLDLGGTNSFLAQPLSDEENARGASTRQSVFRGGRIFWSRAAGAHEVHGAILARYLALGDTASELGLPTSDEYSVPGGRQSAFQGGYLRWSAKTHGTYLIARTA